MAMSRPIRSILKRKMSESKYRKFSREVDALKLKRLEQDNPDFGKPKIKGRKFTSDALKKVSSRKIERFGKNLDLYREGGKRFPEFPGIHGTSGRKLSRKALSKVTERQLKKFDKRKIK